MKLGKTSPSARYAHLLLLDMCEAGTPSVTLQASEGLPPLQRWSHEYGEPRFHRVVDRLKIMSELDPVTCARPTEASFGLAIGDEWPHEKAYMVHARFDDGADDPCVTIRVEEDTAYDPEEELKKALDAHERRSCSSLFLSSRRLH
jgi:hypothetical protein